jgi:hypothetical protein
MLMSFRADIMIEKLKDFPDNVVAVAFHGQVTRTDYETVLRPDFEDRLTRHKKVGHFVDYDVLKAIGVLLCQFHVEPNVVAFPVARAPLRFHAADAPSRHRDTEERAARRVARRNRPTSPRRTGLTLCGLVGRRIITSGRREQRPGQIEMRLRSLPPVAVALEGSRDSRRADPDTPVKHALRR